MFFFIFKHTSSSHIYIYIPRSPKQKYISVFVYKIFSMRTVKASQNNMCLCPHTCVDTLYMHYVGRCYTVDLLHVYSGSRGGGPTPPFLQECTVCNASRLPPPPDGRGRLQPSVLLCVLLLVSQGVAQFDLSGKSVLS